MTESRENRDWMMVGLKVKAEGSLIAFAAGDAIGWPNEFTRKVVRKRNLGSPSVSFSHWVRKSGGQYYPFEESIESGAYSDDTQMLLATARSRMCSGNSWWTHLTQVELPLWTLYERGGGGATKRAASSWAKGVSPWMASGQLSRQYFEAGGNGVAMRILPHVIFHAKQDSSLETIEDVLRDGVSTHGHPRALLGAAVYAFVARWLLRVDRTVEYGEVIDVALECVDDWSFSPKSLKSKSTWDEASQIAYRGDYVQEWRKVVGEIIDLLKTAKHGLEEGATVDDDAVLRELGCFGREKGSGTISAIAAIYLAARFATAPTKGVVKASFANGADTDTIGAMTGGLLGCLCGTDWLPPEWFDVQDSQYLRCVARDLAEIKVGSSSKVIHPPVRQRELDAILDDIASGKREVLIHGSEWASVVEALDPKPLSKSTLAKTWHLRTREGQSLFVTKLGRKTKESLLSDEKIQARTEEKNHFQPVLQLKVVVDNIERTKDFYNLLLGLRESVQSESSIEFGNIVFVQGQEAKSASKTVEFTLSVASDEVVVAKAKAIGIQVQRATHRTQSIWCLIDPDGNIIHLRNHRM
jgi:ADP-ribosylglycohydrolase